MSLDRRIELGLSLSDRGNITRQRESSAGDTGTPPPAPEANDAERFATALERADKTAAETPAPSPFTLFGASAPVVPDLTSRPRRESALTGALAEQVEHLMVSDGQDGRRAVRLELKDDALAGVTVAIEEIDGRLQVDFFCATEPSRRALNDALPAMATSLAERLRRDVLMRVQTDDEDDPCLTEQLGTA